MFRSYAAAGEDKQGPEVGTGLIYPADSDMCANSRWDLGWGNVDPSSATVFQGRWGCDE